VTQSAFDVSVEVVDLACDRWGMHSQRTLALIAAVAGIVSAFMPWVSMGMLSVSGTDGSDGWIVIGIFAIGLIGALAGTKQGAMSGGGRIAAILSGVLGACMGIWKISDVSSVRGKAGAFGAAVHTGIGLYIMAIAGIALVIVSLRKRSA
jgi:hypothetical protein